MQSCPLNRPQSASKNITRGTRSMRIAAAAKPPPTPYVYTPTYKKLGSSSLVIPDITLGTMTWGEQNTESEAHAQLSYAIERGIYAFDSAEVYPVPMKAETQGRTDRFIASWLKHIKRDKVVLMTKVAGNSSRLNWLRESNEGTRLTRRQITESVEASLKRLGTDYIDLLQTHWPDRYIGGLFGAPSYNVTMERDAVPLLEQLEAMEVLIRQGKVRNFGVSNETSWGLTELLRLSKEKRLPSVVSIQNSYSLLVRVPIETDLAEVCSPKNGNVGVLAYSPLAGGVLSGKYNGGKAPAKSRFTVFEGYMARYNNSMSKEAVAAYCAVAEKHGITPVQLSLAFCKSRWFMTSTIIGATSLEQLRDNIDAFAVEFTPDMEADVAAVYKKYRDPAIN